MARENEKDRVKRWTERIKSADDAYTAWEDRFRCKLLYDYYEGQQHAGKTDEEAKALYTINLIFPTIEIQLPSLLFYNPKVSVDPRPPHADDQGATAADRAKLAEDTLQTFIDDPDTHFKLQTILAVRDSQFRFGMVEVGYSADWIDNPNAEKPLLKDGSDEPMKDGEGQDVKQPGKVPREGSERIYVKRIPPECVRVSLSGRHVLGENDWVGYYEWHYVEDVKANPKYRNTAKLKSGGTLKEGDKTDAEQERYRGMIKLWKLWDLRSKTRIVVADGHEKFLLEEPYSYLPLAGLKFFERSDGWYPIPPTANWIDPQDEINDIRDSRKVHRKRFCRRYTYVAGAFSSKAELEKLESGGDGVYAEATRDKPIEPVPDAPMGADTDKALMESRDDFMQITGVGAEARGQAESDTATQANIIETRSRIRETGARGIIADWLGDICRIMLQCLIEKMQLPFWIQIHSDPFAGDMQAAQDTEQVWQQIRAMKLQGLNADVSVDVSSLSPVTEQQQMMAWNQVLMLLTNPGLLMVLMQSEPLLKKTLAYYGIKNPKEIREIQKVGQQVLMMQMMAAQAQVGPTATASGASMPGQPSQPPAGIPASGPSVQ
jgi:hypothetical protein